MKDLPTCSVGLPGLMVMLKLHPRERILLAGALPMFSHEGVGFESACLCALVYCLFFEIVKELNSSEFTIQQVLSRGLFTFCHLLLTTK